MRATITGRSSWLSRQRDDRLRMTMPGRLRGTTGGLGRRSEMVRTKICGITSATEAQLAERLGASAIGVLVGQVHASKDFVEPGVAAQISRLLPPFITPVLVTHLDELDAVIELAQAVAFPVLQLHSDLDAPALRELRTRL